MKFANPALKLAALSIGTVLLLSMGGCGESKPEAGAPAATTSMATKIDINKAPIAELDKLELPGTKPSLSERIQGARPYKTADDMVTKKAISQDELKLIKNLVTIGESK